MCGEPRVCCFLGICAETDRTGGREECSGSSIWFLASFFDRHAGDIEWDSERERVSVCVYVYERGRERERLSVCVRERECVCMCV